MLAFDPQQFVMLLQWMDSAFPTGAFAHSGALETYAQTEDVSNADELMAFIRMKLGAAARSDLIIVHSAMTAYNSDDLAALRDLDQLCAASKVARETREASEKVGRRMLNSVLNIHDTPGLQTLRDALDRKTLTGHHAVIHGAVCAALGLPSRAALLMFGYGLAANQTAAAVKLMAMGQTQAQAVLGACGPWIEDAVTTALALTLDDFESFTPGLDIRAMQHERLFRRLFIS